MSAALNLDALYPVTLTKCCTKCRRQLSVDAFPLRTKDGYTHREGRCVECRREYFRQWRTGALDRVTHQHWPRDPHERACDEALREFRMVGAPFNGPRV